MPGTLFVVATPIGNLEDITLRAVRVLREANLIAAEDTRRTAKLLNHLGLSTPTVSFHEHNTRSRIPQLVARLQGGESVAVVSDAGTPGVSDPGVELVQACIEAGISVDPVPGVSAPLAAVVASGFPVVPLTVLGFAPARSKDRSSWLSIIAGVQWTVTFFEAPHRIRQTLTEAALILGDRPIVVARELTKLHQEFLRGSAASVAGQLISPRGEITVVVGPAVSVVRPTIVHATDADLAAEFGRITNTGLVSRGESVALVAKKFGKSRREVYAAIERAKVSGE
jgi:16S rRNA (cytidine1402-2'-O)-methyltransferase